MQNNKPAGWGQQKGSSPQGWGERSAARSPWKPEPPKPETTEAPKPAREETLKPRLPAPEEEPKPQTPPREIAPKPEKAPAGKANKALVAVIVVLAVLLVLAVVILVKTAGAEQVGPPTVPNAEATAAPTTPGGGQIAFGPTEGTEPAPTETRKPSADDRALISCLEYGQQLLEMTSHYEWASDYPGFDYTGYLMGADGEAGLSAVDKWLNFYVVNNYESRRGMSLDYGTMNERQMPELTITADDGTILSALLRYAGPLLNSCSHTLSTDALLDDYRQKRTLEGELYTYCKEHMGITYEITQTLDERTSDVVIRFDGRYILTVTYETEGGYGVGDYLEFGTYEQDNDLSNGAEPIQWRVLDIEDGKALVVSRYALDCQPYHAVAGAVTWERCTMRKWLNGEFYNTAFSAQERKQIQKTAVEVDWDFLYAHDPGGTTRDDVFLLTATQAARFFRDETDRICTPTDYALARGVLTFNEGKCWWWLRTSSYFLNDAYCVYTLGGMDVNGTGTHDPGGGVRPAMWIDLD